MEANFPKEEEKTLKFWKKNGIFEKSLKKGKSNFVFYEGPPTANGKPGIHHILARVFKDAVCRYKTMRGFKVLRKAGWDTHGLPVELEVEKKLGIKNKKEIERYGIAKFNKKCRESVWWYKKDWEKLTNRIGYWLDMENPYITYQPDYMESVWWILKKISDKGLLFQDYKVVPYCPRCGTALSGHELAQGYKKVSEPAVFVKFKILNPEFKDTSLLVWTTTPWTLPGNVAVALNQGFDYVKVRQGSEFLILAKSRMEAAGLAEGEIVQEIPGKNLLHLRYEPPYPVESQTGMTIYKLLAADFVTSGEGTGFVHISPAFGEDDMELIKKENSKLRKSGEPEFPVLAAVDEDGRFRLEAKKWAGLFVKDADPLIAADLKERGFLFKEELYEHDYPFCWRCKTPLIYYSQKSWFIKMSELKKDLNENNQKINWVPGHLKEGRFGEWLKDVKDWALSRTRYWGIPLPVWQCLSCRYSETVGSVEELLAHRFSSNRYFIMRHGDSLRQVENRTSCWPEKTPFPLTEKGKKQAEKSAGLLAEEKIDFIFSSDLIRARETAEIVAAKTGAKIIIDKSLREFNVGRLNGKNPKLVWEFISSKKNPLSAKVAGGESLAGASRRMYSFLERIDRKYEQKTILFVSHELPLSLLEGMLRGWSLEKTLDFRRKTNKIKSLKTGQFRQIEFKKLPLNEEKLLDLHRPFVDDVKFFCPKCAKTMERVPEVIDCWFDAGAMPYAQYHYPFENSGLIEKNIQFPADFICEAVDQTRGWFYTLLAISTLLGLGPSYRNVISLGHVLDDKGEKMSKSKGNIVDPWYIVAKYGSDVSRWYFYTINQPGDPKLFSEKDVEQSLKRFVLTFWNSFVFFRTYGIKSKKGAKKPPKSKQVLDKWIISRLNLLILKTTESLDEYELVEACRLIEKFVIDDLSLWYIRRSRKRFQKPEEKERLHEASQVLEFVLYRLCALLAPFMPFLSEKIYRELQGSAESVHLEKWPASDLGKTDHKADEKMQKSRETVAEALSQRIKNGIKIRQPLKELQITDASLKGESELLDLIKEEVNVKEITFGKELKLNTEITAELKEEGIVREVIRNIQEMRKAAGLKPKDRILVEYEASQELAGIFEKNRQNIMKEGRFAGFSPNSGKKKSKNKKEIKVEGQKTALYIFKK